MHSRPTIIVFLILVIILLASAFYLYQERAELIPQPERFTELYFDNASYLPQQTTKGQALFFSFTIHNVEGTSTVYPYKTYFEYPDGSQVVLKEGSTTLASDASTTIPVSYIFSTSNLTGKVVVDLPSLNNQQIDFLLPNNS